MRVNIGPYREWIGPYQLADKIPFISEDTADKIGEWLSQTWLEDVCQWLYRKKKRKEYVRIDKYDTWNMDNTLALIILPMLKQLQKDKHGAPYVDDEDVPEAIRSTAEAPKENEWDTDVYHFHRWEWVLSEMIWAFEQIIKDDDYKLDKEDYKKYNDRINNGTRLFGKYYRGLWD